MAEEPEQNPAKMFIDALLDTPTPSPSLTEVGTVTEVGDGVAVVSGLARVLADELLVFASGVRGVVLDLEPDRLGVILLAQRLPGFFPYDLNQWPLLAPRPPPRKAARSHGTPASSVPFPPGSLA